MAQSQATRRWDGADSPFGHSYDPMTRSGESAAVDFLFPDDDEMRLSYARLGMPVMQFRHQWRM
jgi:hypothetical protein